VLGRPEAVRLQNRESSKGAGSGEFDSHKGGGGGEKGFAAEVYPNVKGSEGGREIYFRKVPKLLSYWPQDERKESNGSQPVSSLREGEGRSV